MIWLEAGSPSPQPQMQYGAMRNGARQDDSLEVFTVQMKLPVAAIRRGSLISGPRLESRHVLTPYPTTPNRNHVASIATCSIIAVAHCYCATCHSPQLSAYTEEAFENASFGHELALAALEIVADPATEPCA